MKWSWKIGEYRGIGVYVHATFLLLLGFVALSHWSSGEGMGKTLEGVGFILALFACVVLHEFGHALTAARFGIKTRDITLLPIGGVARLEHMPEKPHQEFWVAVAGPAVNVAIAAILFAWLKLSSTFAPLEEITLTGGPFFERLMLVNLTLVIFNMIPAFPMDGGRVLRALLASRMEFTKATQIAATTGQAIALVFGFLGFFTNPFLLFIALFVWIGAAQEASMVQMKSSLSGIPVLRAMITDFRALAPSDPLSHAADLILAGSQHEFPVVEQGRVVGVLTRQELFVGLMRGGQQTTVSESMHREFASVEATEMLESALQRLQECECRSMPVLRQGELVGLITLDNIGEFVAIQAAIDSRPSRP